MLKIRIKKSPTADTRTCDVSTVTKNQLLISSQKHIHDVSMGIDAIIYLLHQRMYRHDYTKIRHIDEFYKCFKSGFSDDSWWEMHKERERHHLQFPECLSESKDGINLIDILEWLVDGIMAGLARTGTYKPAELPPAMLEMALKNTANMLVDNIVIEEHDYIEPFNDNKE